jgi:sugar phosphate isomerase/epimerase
MRLGVYNAILHDRSLPEALKTIAGLGLTGIELNTGGFLPAKHVPNIDQILESDAARDDFLAIFEGTGVEIAGLNCTQTLLSVTSTAMTLSVQFVWQTA